MMVVLITGCSHTGKTLLAQKLLEKYRFPYLSQDHLKMGLIRSGETTLTAQDDRAMTTYLWPITREIAKTALENQQNLTIEGCYMPFDWKKDFTEEERAHIRYCCLIMTAEYIEKNFHDIQQYANVIEHRLDDSFCAKELLQAENRCNLEACREHGCPYILIDQAYQVDMEL